ncbi:thyrotropin-releasing hormone-degrading ectoenzyme-like isoform X2 [Periplaneta americana]
MVRQIALLLALVSIVLSYDTQLLLSNLKGQQPLPRTVKPYIYLLELHPRLSEGYFNGSVDIHIQCLEPTKIIVLHAHQDLQLENITFTAISTGYAVPTIKEIERNDSTDTLTLTLEEELTERDSYQLHIEFNGLLKTADYQYTATSGGGFFRGTYMDERTLEMRWFAMTSMFPGSARRVFPCFDEPSFKAEFLIGVTHSINMTVLTGWPSYFNQSTEEEGYIKEYFGRTIRIAPFSVGVLVSSFNSSIAMNVTSSQGTTELAVHHVRAPYQPVSMTLAPKVLQFLEDYLQTRLPVNKVDIVAMPTIPYDVKSDFPGLILVQEYMVSDNFEDLHKYLVMQWLSHMVTPETWSAFNVSDVLASYLTTYALSQVSTKRPGFIGDPRSVMYDIFATNINVSSYGDFVPYTKERGVWFMNMLNESLGEQTFRKALGQYIRSNMYTTVTKDTLWSVMKQQALEDGTLPSNVSLQQVADSWLVPDCLRYPVLTVTRNYDDRSASLEQHVFSTELPRSLKLSEQALLWWLPIEYISPGTTVPHLASWMGTYYQEISGLPEEDEYIVVNPTDAGMFLVNYDPHNWRLLKRDFFQLPNKTREKLMNDVLLLANGGELDYKTALNFTLNLFDETDYSVRTPLPNQIRNIEALYSFTPVEEKFKMYLRRMMLSHGFDPSIQPDYQKDSNYANYWYLARELLLKVGYQPKVDEGHEHLQQIMPTFLVNDTSSGMVIFCPEFMRNGSEEDWEKHNEELQNFLNTEYESKPFLERSLAKCPGYSGLIERVLNRTLDDTAVFSSMTWYNMVNLITSSSKAQNISLEFFFKHYNELKHKFYFMQDMWTNMVSRLTDNIKTEGTLRKLNEFCKEHEGKLGYTQTVFDTAIKKARKTIEWCRRSLPDIKIWLDEVFPSAGVIEESNK